MSVIPFKLVILKKVLFARGEANAQILCVCEDVNEKG